MAALYDRWRWLIHRVETSRFVADWLPQAIAMAHTYAELMRLNKPIGIFLLLWPALWALWLSSHGRPNPQVFLIFMFGVLVTRSAGCVINDYADRNLDAHVARTKNRPLADKRIQPRAALILFFALALLALTLASMLNELALEIALVGAAMIIAYPFFKRFFPLPQAFLGAAFSFSIPMAYAAQTNTIPRVAWLLFIANILWTTAYDTMYAMADRDDDLKIGIKSSAILFGDADKAFTALLQATALLALGFVGRDMKLGGWYLAGLGVATIFAIYEQALINKRVPQDCLRAFLNNNYFGMSVFAGIALDFIFS